MDRALEDSRQENRNLRTELMAVKAVYQKQREEKEATKKALEDALEEIQQLREELDLREQRFWSMKEDKDNEILLLKQNVRDLERQLAEYTDTDNMVKEEENLSGEFLVKAPEIPDIPASEIVESLKQWEGMDQTIDLFKELLITESECTQWTPGTSAGFSWKPSLYLYLSNAEDTAYFGEEILQNLLPQLQEMCKENGSSVTQIGVNANELSQLGVQVDVIHSLSKWIIEQSDFFIGVIKNELNMLTKYEAENAFLNNPSTKNAVFIFLPPSDDVTSSVQENSKVVKFKDRIRKFSDSHIIECGYNLKSALEELKERLVTRLKESFGIVQLNESKRGTFEALSLTEDMKFESEQRCLYDQHIKYTPLLEENSVVFERLNEYILEGSPVKGVFFVTGASGSGKSTLIANWIKRLPSFADAVVFYHFVKIIGSSSAEPCGIYRRFILQLQLLTKDDSEIPYTVKELPTFFLKLLKRVSSTTSKIVTLVLDNLDFIKNFEEYFSWMLKPLPSGVRVIATASEEDLPDIWRYLQSVTIPEFSYSDASDLVGVIQEHLNMDTLTSDQIPALGVNAAYSPLWCSMATRHVLYSADKDMDENELNELLDGYENFQGFSDLLHHILECLHLKYSNMFIDICTILQLLYWSRNGLLLPEIQQGVSSPVTCALFLYELLRRNIIMMTEGLYYIHNIQVQEAVESLLCTDQSTDYMLTWTGVLVDIFSDSGELIARQTEELLWLFKRAELKKELYYAILNVDILKQMFASFRIGELLDYWQYLHPNDKTMALQYFKHLKILEKEDEEDRLPSFYIEIFETVGRILMELGYHDEALPCLQYSVELCESYCDPESLEIARIFAYLGKCNYSAGSYSASEGYLTEALQIFENVFSCTSDKLLQVLQVLEKVTLKLGKEELSEIVSTRIFSIKQMASNKACKILANRYQEVEDLLHNTDDVEYKAVLYNESAVVIAAYGSFEYAEMRMMEGISLLESLSSYTLTSLHVNLGKLYFSHDQLEMATVLFEKAYELLTNPLGPHKRQWIMVAERLFVLYRNQGRIESAKTTQKCILRHLQEVYNPSHLRVAKALNNLAVLYCFEQNFDEAIPAFEEAIKLYKYNLGESNETILRAVNNMNLAIVNQKKQSLMY